MNALLDEWEMRNTQTVVTSCGLNTQTITEGVLNFFGCFVIDAMFDPGLDFAVREWARRDHAVRTRIDRADTARLEAERDMFARHGYEPDEADIRARILYFMQIGYHALEQKESIELRLSRVEGFLKGFTGRTAAPAELDAFRDYVANLTEK